MKKYYYVYKVKDNKMNKFYIGVRGSNDIPYDDIGKKYFTSSVNKDFISRMKTTPTDFTFKVIKEFTDWNGALEYEYKLLRKFKANTNKHMYNKSITLANKFSENFSVFDKLQNEWIVVNSEIYQQDKDRYTHHNKGMVSCINKITGEMCYITTEEFWSNDILEHITKNRKHTKETINKIKRAITGKNNPFYNKKHTKESMDQMVHNRLKSGEGDYHHGKNPFTDKQVIKKCKEARKKHGNWQGRIFTYKGKEYDAVWRFTKDFPYISKKNFRTFLKLNPVTLDKKLIEWYLKLRKMEQEGEDTKYKKRLRRNVIDTSFGKIPVYYKWNKIKEELMINKEVTYARCC